MRIIARVKAIENFQIEVTYSDGTQLCVDVQPYISQGGVFSVLKDRELFRQVQVGLCGRSVEWPGDID
jgi:hypothetical protein